MAVVSSAAPLLAQLDEDDDALRLHALQSLNSIVHDFWFQIASSLASVEAFYEDESFTHRELAALVASKVFYHLGELDDALTYALGAGQLFDITEKTEYVQTLLARCIDMYVELRSKPLGDSAEVDPRLDAVVQRMFERCYQDGRFEQAIGIGLESKRLDKLEEAIKRSPDTAAMLTYALKVCQELVVNRGFRQQVLRLLIKLYESVPTPDWGSICQCLMFLDDSAEVAKILDSLLEGSEEDALLAYQICFDLLENEMQAFLLRVEGDLKVAPKSAAAQPIADGESGGGSPQGQVEPMDTGEAAPSNPPENEGEAAAASPEEKRRQKRGEKLLRVLRGQASIQLYLEFLHSHNHADLQLLKNVKSSIEARNSVCHGAAVFANAVMHSGTTVDTFLRENLDWLSRATNWSKFSATAGLGVIHRGHLAQGRALMSPYLPHNGSVGSPFSEGGALYALGLIHANHGQDIRSFLLESLGNTSNETVQHGACLGLGLAALGTDDDDIFEDIKAVLFMDNAVAGEAAGIALGLVSAGSATDKATELLAYAHDTQHEKIIRGVALGLALIMYGREEGADTLIEQMTRDQDQILRYGGIFAIGMAYRGTANNAAIQRLLHFAVSDVSDNVRRAAVMNLGFLLMGVPKQCPKIVSLLSESYNPHVRYGAAMAVGISCGSTGMQEALDLLTPLLSDSVDFVRQGALIATALVLMQQPESKVAGLRKRLQKVVGDKHEEVMCRMGAIMAVGILDAGGRNCVLGLRSRSGYFRRTSCIGMMVFMQYWYWYPLAYFLSLALQPTALIGLNQDLKLPKFQGLLEQVTANCKPSLFAYPTPITQEASTQVSKVPTAVLSTTVRARHKAKSKEAAKAGKQAKQAQEEKPEEMETDESPKAVDDKVAAEKKEEPASHQLDNPARVVPAQEKLVSFPEGSRWRPVRGAAQPVAGIIVLTDTRPDESAELVNDGNAEGSGLDQEANGNGPSSQPLAAMHEDKDEPAPPVPFQYVAERRNMRGGD